MCSMHEGPRLSGLGCGPAQWHYATVIADEGGTNVERRGRGVCLSSPAAAGIERTVSIHRRNTVSTHDVPDPVSAGVRFLTVSHGLHKSC